MIEFDFITDDRFRDSLIADYVEFRASLSAEAWKAALVLVGSVVEALLVDHLISTDYKTRVGTDPLKMHLGELIVACQKETILSEKTASLSSVIQKYRNLIHPGRSVRLGEVASKSAAIVAGELLQMIVDEISARKRAQYGYTAEQIVKKLERDQSAMSIHKHLLSDVPAFEIERLLLKVIPRRYFELDTAIDGFGPEPDTEGQSRLAMCFRSAFDMASDEIKKKITASFVAIMKKEDQHIVLTYETAFFRASDLQYLPASDAKLVKDHLLSRIQAGISLDLVAAMEGLPEFLDQEDIAELVDTLLKVCLSKVAHQLKSRAHRYIIELWMGLPGGPEGKDRLVVSRLQDWISHFEKTENPESADVVRKLRAEIEDMSIPF
jgi:hypothetical protein